MEADAALRSQIFAYRSIVRGIAPPPEAFEHVHPNMGQPPLDSAALIEAEFSAESELAKGLQAHQHALCDVPADLPAPIRVPLAVERHLPGLLPMQRALRAEIGGYCDRSRLVEEATASLALRRARRTRQPRELRDAERTERKRATEAVRGCTRPAHLEHRTPPFSASLTVPLPPAHLASRWPNILHAIATSCLPCLRQDTARKRLRDEFLLAVAMHTDEFRGFHRDVRKGASRLGKAVLASFDGKARKEKRDGERAQRERLRALKENNMEEYMKLVSDSKNERITQLLKETDNYLAELGDKVRLQKQGALNSDPHAPMPCHATGHAPGLLQSTLRDAADFCSEGHGRQATTEKHLCCLGTTLTQLANSWEAFSSPVPSFSLRRPALAPAFARLEINSEIQTPHGKCAE